MDQKALPIGIEDFKEIVQGGYYYVDKTLLIKELIDKRSKVNLFTRPRRFGKTLCLSMLQYFFQDTGDKIINQENRNLFQQMKVIESGERYVTKMQSYPVVHLSLKSAKQPDWKQSYYCICDAISRQFAENMRITDALELLEDKEKFSRLARRTATREEYCTSLEFLSYCMRKYYQKKIIFLIDEYDVPLENAYFCDFYNEMADFVRSLFESALKTNDNMEFTVITGCLRISKESIFTGLNNLEAISILNENFGEYFGFIQQEVDEMLKYYGFQSKSLLVRQWYDGYLFGNTEVYNPWSIVNYVKALAASPDALPCPYWSNTSSNDIVKQLIEHSGLKERDEIEQLIEGGSIQKPVHEDITYEDVYTCEDNLWNFLFFTGYLKQTRRILKEETQYVTLAIPNMEVRYIYKNTVRGWFDQNLKSKDLTNLFQGLFTGNTGVIEEEISQILLDTISFFDYAESYYHGFLAGIMNHAKGYLVYSNREEGYGRPDILLCTPSRKGQAIIIEIKVASSYPELNRKCDEALTQIKQQKYCEGLKKEGYNNILAYGICFYKKECIVKKMK